MGKDKYGSLFEGILNKTPDVADKLKHMANRNSEMPSKEDVAKEETLEETDKQKKPQTKKTNNPMANVVVEKKRISQRVRTKPSKPKSASKPPKQKKSKKVPGSIGTGLHKATPSSPNRFFDGIPENAHQFGLNDGTQVLDIVIGLDFGTSSTKVVVHAPNYTGNPAYAIPFGKYAHASLKYLLPTKLAVDKNGVCHFSPKEGSATITNIKTALMTEDLSSLEIMGDTPPSTTPMEATTAYLALILRYVRGWFLANKRSIFQDFHINWSVNLGLPAAIDDDPTLREKFDFAGKAAWLLSRKSGCVTLKDAKSSLEDLEQLKEDEFPCDFSLIPEVIAEVTGYARSEFRNEGLHFLVDVGASTLDVCAFELRNNEGDDHYKIYTADVEPLGSHMLHQARINGAKNAFRQFSKDILDAQDPLSIIPNDLTTYVPSKEIVVKSIKEENVKFAKNSRIAVHKTIWHTYKKRYPNSPRWSETLPVFVCGGARAIGLYEDVLQGVNGWLNDFISTCKGVRIIPLPKPKSLEAEVNDTDYHRLAVAWGLSHENFNIGTYDRPSEIDDVAAPRKLDISDRFIGPEMT